LLRDVHEKRPNGKTQRYVAHVRGIGNPVFRNEKAYARVRNLDADLRLLLLFRFWNAVQHWSPYRDLADPWPIVLEESIPEFDAEGEGHDVARRLLTLTARVHDTHTNLWSVLDHRPPTGSYRPSIAVRFVADGEACVASIVDAGTHADLLVGDVIVAVDGEPVDELVHRWSPLYAASNEPTRLRDMAAGLLDGEDVDVTLTVDRGGRPVKVVVERTTPCMPDRRTHELEGATFQRLADDVAYLKVSTLAAADCPSFIEAAADCRGLVVDLRAYPADSVAFALGGHLVRQPTPFASFSVAHASNPGAFTMIPGAPIEPRTPYRRAAVVALVDETTQSAAEFTAMALRACGALVVGETTAGTDGNVSLLTLPGGLQTTISGIGVYFPDGSPTQRVGIVPDVRVPVTVGGVRQRRDEQLVAAIDLIRRSPVY
jgi:C-terminal processing protease CtpA/Prc